MDAVGSRMGRSSSRYGSTTVFNGPVRRWKKKWVHVSPSKPTLSSSHSQANGSGSSLCLCRWTPISSGGGAPAAAEEEEEPRRRKFRYTPIAVLDEQSKAVAKKSNEEALRKPIVKNDEIFEKRDMDEEMQDSRKSDLNLGLDLEGTDNGNSSGIEDEDAQLKEASSSGFWSTG
ncbi:uncharacterized protein LOC116211379 [Punica granatum]|uniref:Uncharacterized protein n=2 Tax=Punica granatum TaxID=22663 RepID=A0A218X8P5_PUNGR|nr:uncharacterized protein LOC116211379 [Punica granatum]OWM81317.1 hypothetical protein CDL15_Pgr007355 [Punica granatum]PKI67759.1 hypothetical protein CRG98_011972 [Punica granatum]